MKRIINIVGANIIEEDGKILLIQEGKSLKEWSGLWNFPAGKMDSKEKIVDCAKRESREETGLEVESKYLVGIYQSYIERPDELIEAIVFVFASEKLGGNLMVPNDEIMDLKWYKKDEIEKLFDSGKLRKPFIWKAVQDYYAGKRTELNIFGN